MLIFLSPGIFRGGKNGKKNGHSKIYIIIFLSLRLGVTKCYMTLKTQSNSASNDIL